MATVQGEGLLIVADSEHDRPGEEGTRDDRGDAQGSGADGTDARSLGVWAHHVGYGRGRAVGVPSNSSGLPFLELSHR